MTLGQDKVLLHLSGRRQRVVDAGDIYYLEAQGDETDVRLRDVRSLGEVLKQIGPLGFVRIHRKVGVIGRLRPGHQPGDVRSRTGVASGSRTGTRR